MPLRYSGDSIRRLFSESKAGGTKGYYTGCPCSYGRSEVFLAKATGKKDDV